MNATYIKATLIALAVAMLCAPGLHSVISRF